MRDMWDLVEYSCLVWFGLGRGGLVLWVCDVGNASSVYVRID